MPLRWKLENGVPVSFEEVYIREPAPTAKRQPNTSKALSKPKSEQSVQESKAPSSSTRRVSSSIAKQARTPAPKKLKAQNLAPTQSLSKKPMIMCSVCQQNLREDNWDKHIRKVHAAATRLQPATKQTKRPKPPQSGRVNKENGYHGSSRRRSSASEMSTEQRHAIRGLSEELAYGDKYLGQMRREADGRFGSIPLYDDYSENSGPD